MDRTNRLLAAIEPETRQLFGAAFHAVNLTAGEALHPPGAIVEDVYFPEGALIGVVTGGSSGEALQTNLVGLEGAFGAFEACGTRRSMFLAEVHAAGPAWRISAADYRRLFDACQSLRTAVHKFVELQLTEARQFVACNALHPVGARLARALLEASEKRADALVPATQAALAEVLGVQRTTVTAAITQLECSGAVRARRGAVEILRADVLEQAACPCRRMLTEARAEIRASPEDSCEAALGQVAA